MVLVLPHGMAPALAGARVLELTGGDRQPVNREHQIQGVVFAWVAEHLARKGELVLRVERHHLVVEPVRGLEVG